MPGGAKNLFGRKGSVVLFDLVDIFDCKMDLQKGVSHKSEPMSLSLDISTDSRRTTKGSVANIGPLYASGPPVRL